MKVFNHDFQPTDSAMHAMLKKANLTGNGYKKEVIKKEVQDTDDGTQEYEVCHCAHTCMQVTNPQLKTWSFMLRLLQTFAGILAEKKHWYARSFEGNLPKLYINRKFMKCRI